jgi:hypothetical protein
VQFTVRCRCNVQRRIDTSQVGPWRLRCKQCGDVLYDPSAAPIPGTHPGVTAAAPPPAPTAAPPPPRPLPPPPPAVPPQARPRAPKTPIQQPGHAVPISDTGVVDPVLTTPAPSHETHDGEGGEDSTFQQWLHGSAELKVLLSSDGLPAPKCKRHPARRIVAGCTRCSELLCKFCLDRIDDEFVCSECVAAVATKVDLQDGGLKAWFRKIFGG